MKRRQFLQAALAAGALSPWCGVSRLAYGASTAPHPLLVSLFLRGGADGLHLLGPAADPDYQGVRPPELRVMDRGPDQGWPLANSLDSRLDFRLHRQGAALAQLYGAGVLSFVHGVGLEDATRSHFVAQELVEGGLTDEKALSGGTGGWLSRALGHFSQAGPVPAFCAGTNTDRSLAGYDRVLSAPDLNHGLLPPGAKPPGNCCKPARKGAIARSMWPPGAPWPWWKRWMAACPGKAGTGSKPMCRGAGRIMVKGGKRGGAWPP